RVRAHGAAVVRAAGAIERCGDRERTTGRGDRNRTWGRGDRERTRGRGGRNRTWGRGDRERTSVRDRDGAGPDARAVASVGFDAPHRGEVAASQRGRPRVSAFLALPPRADRPAAR